MKQDKKTMIKQRRILAAIGFLLPIVCVVMGFPFLEKNGPTFWYSISATYYATCGSLMIIALGTFAFFLFSYKGYDLGDFFTTTFSGTMALLIVFFPCRCDAAGPTTGILNLPTDVSHIIHCIAAALFFASFAYMIGFRFTKTSGTSKETTNKKKRNMIYQICSCLIIFAMTIQVITSFIGIGWMTIVNETIMLWAFSFAWLIKADTFKSLLD